MLIASELLGLGQVHEIWHKETPKTYTLTLKWSYINNYEYNKNDNVLSLYLKNSVHKFSGFYSSCDQMVVFFYVSAPCNG